MQTIEATENAFSYTTCEDPLGTLCVVASDRGLRWIEHGEDRERVVRAARERFADARLVRDDVRLREFAAAIAALSGGGRPGGRLATQRSHDLTMRGVRHTHLPLKVD